MRPVSRAVCVVISLFVVGATWSSRAQSQGVPTPSPSAKACAWFPVAEIEKHFGTKAQNLGGLDQGTRNTCSASFPDPSRAAMLESHPSLAADLSMTAAQRLTFLKSAMKDEVIDSKDFGKVGCFQSTMDMGKPVRATTCFVAQAPYLALSLHSVDSAQVTYDIVRPLLEIAAARRK